MQNVKLVQALSVQVGKWAALLAAAALTTPLLAAQTGPEPSRALTNWLVAASSFRKAGAFISEEKDSQAKAELGSGATNLPSPYNAMAAGFLSKLDSALNLSTNQSDPRRLRALVTLCTDMGASAAALKLQMRSSDNASPSDLADDALYAWRLFDGTNSKAALEEYQRRLDSEHVEYWQDYYRVQVRLLQARSTALTNVQHALEVTKGHYLKGLEAHADLFGALRELTRVVPYVKNANQAIPVYQLILRCLAELGDEAGREAWQDKFLADYLSDPEVCALVYVDRAQKAYHRQDMTTSENYFRKVCNDYASTSVYGDALYGLGLVLQETQRYDAAMAEYTKIFYANLNEGLRDPDSSEDYPNFKFKAALRMSECYEATKDLKKALEYALMARDQYKFISYCKDCLHKTRQNVENRVKQLQEALNKPAAPATVP